MTNSRVGLKLGWCALALMVLGVLELFTACGGGASGGTPVTAVAAPAAAATTAPPAAIALTEVASGLANPWGLAFLPDGRMLVTERGGRLRLMVTNGSSSSVVSGVPAVAAVRQGGLLDVVLDPAFASNQRIYLSFSERDLVNPALNGTAVARAELDTAALTLRKLTVIYQQSPKVASTAHFGSRLVFDRNGFLFVTLGYRTPHEVFYDLEMQPFKLQSDALRT